MLSHVEQSVDYVRKHTLLLSGNRIEPKPIKIVRIILNNGPLSPAMQIKADYRIRICNSTEPCPGERRHAGCRFLLTDCWRQRPNWLEM